MLNRLLLIPRYIRGRYAFNVMRACPIVQCLSEIPPVSEQMWNGRYKTGLFEKVKDKVVPILKAMAVPSNLAYKIVAKKCLSDLRKTSRDKPPLRVPHDIANSITALAEKQSNYTERPEKGYEGFLKCIQIFITIDLFNKQFLGLCKTIWFCEFVKIGIEHIFHMEEKVVTEGSSAAALLVTTPEFVISATATLKQDRTSRYDRLLKNPKVTDQVFKALFHDLPQTMQELDKRWTEGAAHIPRTIFCKIEFNNWPL